jgi:hypothetical protein
MPPESARNASHSASTSLTFSMAFLSAVPPGSSSHLDGLLSCCAIFHRCRSHAVFPRASSRPSATSLALGLRGFSTGAEGEANNMRLKKEERGEGAGSISLAGSSCFGILSPCSAMSNISVELWWSGTMEA